MMNKLALSKVFLKSANLSVNEATLKEYMPLWWQNTRENGGLRLTDQGYEFVTVTLGIQTYEIPFPKDFKLTSQTIIFLDRLIECPYYVYKNGLSVTDEKKALELHLFSGDVRKYGLVVAMKRQKTT
jgi:hypothetical protein